MSKLQIGWIGLGKMGVPMSKRLLADGYPVCVYNRTKAKADSVLTAGATWCGSMADLGSKAEIVFSMIADDKALQQVALDAGNVLDTMRPGSIFIEMSTVSPTLSAKVAAACQERKIGYLRAPVSGSTVLADSGKLTVLCSGPKESFEKAKPLFEQLAAKVFHVGENDEARFLKLLLNMMVGTTAAMLGEAVAFGEAGGLNWEQMLEVIGASVVASPLVAYKLAPLSKRDFSPAFEANQMAKDFDLVLDAAKNVNAVMPVTSLVRQFWTMMHAQGKGGQDFFAYVTLMEDLGKLK